MDDPKMPLPRDRVVVHAIHPPPLGDEAMTAAMHYWADKNGRPLQGEITMPPHRARTAMSMAFNALLGAEVCRHGFGWVDISPQLMDEEGTGIVAKRFRKNDMADIHLEERATAPIYAEAYRKGAFGFAGQCGWP